MSAIRVIAGKGHCQEHGHYEYTAYAGNGLVVGRACPACMARNQQRLHERSEAAQLQLRQRQMEARVRETGVPDIFLTHDFASYVPVNPKAMRNLGIVRSYAQNFKTVLQTKPSTGLLLHGLTGTGKTHLACALVRELTMDGYTARYASAPMLLSRLREASRGDLGQPLSQLMSDLSSAHLLVLDEYGAHTRTDFDYQLLFQLIDARYQRNLPTATVTNVDIQTFETELDQRLLERLLGTAAPKLAFDWASQRSKQPGRGQ